jgi:chorismate dehydratase
VIDLAEEWRKHTAKPFVFAFWAVREEALARFQSGAATRPDAVRGLAEVFQRSRDHGIAPDSVRRIAEKWAPRLGIRRDDVISYLTVNIHYSLDDPCLEGLALFYKYAAECGALPSHGLPALERVTTVPVPV